MSVWRVKFIAFFSVLFSLSLYQPQVEAAPYILFGEYGAGTIKRVNSDGTNLSTVVSGISQPMGIDADPAGGKMYWGSWTGSQIQRSNLDGSSVETLYNATIFHPQFGVAVHAGSGKLYFGNWDAKILMRVNLDGSGSVENILSSLNNPGGLSIDSTNGKIYIANGSGSNVILRANLDGTGLEALVTSGYFVRDIALDVSGGKMYFQDYSNSTGRILRANLDGTNIETVLSGLEYPDGLAIDTATQTIFFAQQGSSQSISKVSFNGSGYQSIVTGLSTPIGVEFVEDLINTPVGTNVQVTLTGSDFITHENVTAEGISSASAYSGFSPSQDFSYMGDWITDTFFDITSTATNTGDYLVALHYLDADFTSDILSNPMYADFIESQLRGFHLEGGVWMDRTATAADLAFFGISDVPVNTATNTIYMRTSSLSPFGVGVNPEPATLILLGSALLGLLPLKRRALK